MSIEKITAKIEQDAKVEIDAVLADAKRTAWEIVERAQKKAEQLVKDAETKGQEDRDKQVQSRHSVAVIDGKNMVLSYKQKLIGECFEEALDKIASMDEDSYLDYLTGIVQSSGITKGEIILSPRDRKYADKLTALLAEKLPGSDFRISDEVKDYRGGLILRQGSTYYNASVEAVRDSIESEMTQEIAAILFGDQEK